jgi:WD40 repeat protein
VIASGTSDGKLRLCDAWTGELKLILEGHRGRIMSVAFAPDGKAVATGCEDDGTLKL